MSFEADLGADFCVRFNLLTFAVAGVSESGGKRTRTADFLRARQALYQLSYTPTGD
jgi:hypothetical protein